MDFLPTHYYGCHADWLASYIKRCRYVGRCRHAGQMQACGAVHAKAAGSCRALPGPHPERKSSVPGWRLPAALWQLQASQPRSRLTAIQAAFPAVRTPCRQYGLPIWLTEFACPNRDGPAFITYRYMVGCCSACSALLGWMPYSTDYSTRATACNSELHQTLLSHHLRITS